VNDYECVVSDKSTKNQHNKPPDLKLYNDGYMVLVAVGV